jgi:hypothetical protein
MGSIEMEMKIPKSEEEGKERKAKKGGTGRKEEGK